MNKLDKRFIVRIDAAMLKLIDKCVAQNRYKWRTRSDFVRSTAYKALVGEGYIVSSSKTQGGQKNELRKSVQV
jgi:hypothetical protein